MENLDQVRKGKKIILLISITSRPLSSRKKEIYLNTDDDYQCYYDLRNDENWISV